MANKLKGEPKFYGGNSVAITNTKALRNQDNLKIY